MVFAAGGVGKLRAAAVTGLGGPGVHTGEVEVLSVGALVESVQKAVDVGVRRDLLPQLARQCGLQVLAVFHATTGQHPVRVLAGADPPDRQQVSIR
jgi:hypothetical protein